MSARKMHADEVDTDVSLVRRLLATQFPQWADLAIEPVASAGTDNAIYRLGDDKAVRLPRIWWAVPMVDKEQRWLPKLAPHLPLTIPVPLAMGVPGEGYPWHWSITPWLEGETWSIDRIGDLRRAAMDLARFITTLQRIDTTGAPGRRRPVRGAPLAEIDRDVRAAIPAWRDMVDTDALTAAWDRALAAPTWDGRDVWLHGDLLPGNLLVRDGRLSAVIDFGCLSVGDPACDLMAAWTLFAGESREVFRTALAADDATWARARGWAVTRVGTLPYYAETNRVIVADARRTIDEVLADLELGA